MAETEPPFASGSPEGGGGAGPMDGATVFAAERRDRQRLSGELHDQPVQVLSAAQWQLEALSLELPDAQRDRLQQTVRALGQAQRQLRTMMSRLDPPALAVEGLAIATQDLLEETFGDDLAIQFDTSSLTEPPIGSRSVLFRIIERTVCTVSIAANHDAPRVTVTLGDDGGGTRFHLVVDLGADASSIAGAGEDEMCGDLAVAAGGRWRRTIDGSHVEATCWLPRW